MFCVSLCFLSFLVSVHSMSSFDYISFFCSLMVEELVVGVDKSYEPNLASCKFYLSSSQTPKPDPECYSTTEVCCEWQRPLAE